MRTHFTTKNPRRLPRHYLAAGLVLLALGLVLPAAAQANVTANVVAMDQVLVYNRLGAFNPAGMIFALARDVFPKGTSAANQTLGNSCANAACTPGNVQLRDNKRPRPLTLRVNEGDTITITLTNLLSNQINNVDAGNEAPGILLPDILSEKPKTLNVGIHINGLQWATGPSDDGSRVGPSQNSLVGPGQSTTYTLRAEKEGAYTITSGPNLGGQGGNGAIANGLFGILNVEPAGSVWYRSQLTRAEMQMATTGTTGGGQPIMNYNAVYPPGHPYAGKPILKILDGTEIFHNELNAVISNFAETASDTVVYPNRGEAFREFTIAFHDEIKVNQAFKGWFDALPFTLGSVKDGFAINYGTGGIGSEIIGNRLGVGPMHECVECKYEEFFLTSWAVGDPAMIVDRPANQGLELLAPGATPANGTTGPKATKAFYPDDPSNVWHGYLNDRTKIRNIHVGTEHHIFHLHAHQWLFASLDDDSNYLDAQALGPGSSFTYEIAYGGGGNRNKTVGDAIFHCHFYPHFAQGMWGLWRVHDTFEIGSLLNVNGLVLERGLPDGEIAGGGYDAAGNPIIGGTPTPAVVPIPGKAMAPMPGLMLAALEDTDDDGIPDAPGSEEAPFMGYPFYIPGVAGHRPPTPPIDLMADGGIPRHVITGGTADATQTPTNFDKVLLSATGFQLPEAGTLAERVAMNFHGPQSAGTSYTHDSYQPNGSPATNLSGFEVNGLPPIEGAPYAEPCRNDDGTPAAGAADPRFYAASVIELDVDFNKVGWHFGQQRIITLDGDVADTLAGRRAPEPFVMRANTGDCVDFNHTNLVPNVYQLDDFQVKTPTDVIGQHIHLVKFDVTSADGAANGYNYEDGTLSPDETAERIHALTARRNRRTGDPGGQWNGDPLGTPGPRITRQRWYIDSGWTGNVFTHDHYGPSTHQQAGLYGTLLVEPQGSIWRDPETGVLLGTRINDGGPTSWRADILHGENSYREFYLEFADFQLAYRPDGTPVNPSDRIEVGLPYVLETPPIVRPEAISAADPGTFVVNYRNEPVAHRVWDGDTANPGQAPGPAGDLAYAFQSRTDRALGELNADPARWPYNSRRNRATASTGALAGDPFTPLLRVYEGDRVVIRAQVGAHEEGHNFSINGIKWLQQKKSAYSGFRNSQMMGISEQFLFEVPGVDRAGELFDDFLYKVGSSVDAIWNGSWGLMRAYAEDQVDLQRLPSNLEGLRPPANNTAQCPDDSAGPDMIEDGTLPPDGGPPAPRTISGRLYEIAAVRAADVLPDLEGDLPGSDEFDGGTLVYNSRGPLHDPTALLYVMKDDVLTDPETGAPVGLAEGTPIEPLTLRAAAGECIAVELTNMLPEVLHGPDPAFAGQTADLAGFNTLPVIVEHFNANQVRPSSHVGLHPQLVDYPVHKSDGMNVGGNETQTAAPGETVSYRWYAGHLSTDADGNLNGTPMEFGAINLIPADPIKHSNKGLIGALVIEPSGAVWTEDDGTRASATVTHAGGSFRDFVVINQDDVNLRFADGSPVPSVSAEEEPEDSGQKGINYRTEPSWLRLGYGPTADPGVTRLIDYTNVWSNSAVGGDPETPVFTAAPGQQVRFRVLKPGGHNRNQVFTLHGHLWARHPWNYGSTVIDPNNTRTFWHGEQMGHGPTNHFNAVPLGGAGVAGDYLYRDMVPVHVDNGQWGIFRVTSP